MYSYVFTCKVIIILPIHSAGHTVLEVNKDAINHICAYEELYTIHSGFLHIYITSVEGQAHKRTDTVVQALSCSQKVQVHIYSQSSNT